MATTVSLDTRELEAKLKDMYRQVAEQPHGTYHFELGRRLAEHLGYPVEVLEQIPAAPIESFAGVGYFDLAELRERERVIDLGSGSGADVFFAVSQVGPEGFVVGIDFTAQQLAKARRLAAEAGLEQVEFREGHIESPPAEDESCDCVISNGVINLSPHKARVFREAARLLRPGGRLAIADIVSKRQLKESIVSDADLWASCIGGAVQEDAYLQAIEAAGLHIDEIRENPYEFVSERARNASAKYGVRSVSVLAHNP
jgi:arsenite methyltransferase